MHFRHDSIGTIKCAFVGFIKERFVGWTECSILGIVVGLLVVDDKISSQLNLHPTSAKQSHSNSLFLQSLAQFLDCVFKCNSYGFLSYHHALCREDKNFPKTQRVMIFSWLGSIKCASVGLIVCTSVRVIECVWEGFIECAWDGLFECAGKEWIECTYAVLS